METTKLNQHSWTESTEAEADGEINDGPRLPYIVVVVVFLTF